MRFAVLGATGALGSHFVVEAVAAGHEVVAYARRPKAVRARDGVTTVGGEVEDRSALAAAVTGCDAVVSFLGPAFRMGSRTPVDFMQRTLPVVRAAAADAGVPNLVLTSAFGVGDTAAKASLPARAVYALATRPLFEDKARAEAAIDGTAPPVTVVYPVNLKEAASTGTVTVRRLAEVGSVPGLPTLPFVDAARGVLTVATTPALVGQRVLITTGKGWRPAA